MTLDEATKKALQALRAADSRDEIEIVICNKDNERKILTTGNSIDLWVLRQDPDGEIIMEIYDVFEHDIVKFDEWIETAKEMRLL